MGLQGYVGNATDAARIRRLEREREEEKQLVEELKKSKAKEPAGFRKWQHGTNEVLESAFKQETVGIISKEEYVTKKATIEARLEAEALKRKRTEESQAEEERNRKKAEILKQRQAAKLSFAEDDDVDEDEEEDKDDEPAALPRLKKDDAVRTDFLPDADRERRKEELRNKLKQEWREQQEKLKKEELHIDYSYWDGSGHRRHAVIKVGDKITDLLKVAREQLATDFREMRHVSVDNLIFVKDDIILPQTMTFYELIAGQVSGKQGPLFVEPSAVKKEQGKEEGRHSAKVVERHWYERSKHIFPANRWVLFDADVHVKRK